MSNYSTEDTSDWEQLNARVPREVNDWLNGLVRDSKRRTGSKIRKEIFIQGAITLLQAMTFDFEKIRNKENFWKEIEKTARLIAKESTKVQAAKEAIREIGEERVLGRNVNKES